MKVIDFQMAFYTKEKRPKAGGKTKEVNEYTKEAIRKNGQVHYRNSLKTNRYTKEEFFSQTDVQKKQVLNRLTYHF